MWWRTASGRVELRGSIDGQSGRVQAIEASDGGGGGAKQPGAVGGEV